MAGLPNLVLVRYPYVNLSWSLTPPSKRIKIQICNNCCEAANLEFLYHFLETSLTPPGFATFFTPNGCQHPRWEPVHYGVVVVNLGNRTGCSLLSALTGMFFYMYVDHWRSIYPHPNNGCVKIYLQCPICFSVVFLSIQREGFAVCGSQQIWHLTVKMVLGALTLIKNHQLTLSTL